MPLTFRSLTNIFFIRRFSVSMFLVEKQHTGKRSQPQQPERFNDEAPPTKTILEPKTASRINPHARTVYKLLSAHSGNSSSTTSATEQTTSARRAPDNVRPLFF
jgi:hypothetical protein